jgi:hypothetical protein
VPRAHRDTDRGIGRNLLVTNPEWRIHGTQGLFCGEKSDTRTLDSGQDKSEIIPSEFADQVARTKHICT